MIKEEMTLLIYLFRVWSCGLFLRMREGDEIYLQLLHAFFLDREWENGFAKSANRPILNKKKGGNKIDFLQSETRYTPYQSTSENSSLVQQEKSSLHIWAYAVAPRPDGPPPTAHSK
jgi:hypothetical protein